MEVYPVERWFSTGTGVVAEDKLHTSFKLWLTKQERDWDNREDPKRVFWKIAFIVQAKIKDTDCVVQGGSRNIIRKSIAHPFSKQVESLAIVPSLRSRRPAGFLLSLVPLPRHLPINNLILMRLLWALWGEHRGTAVVTGRLIKHWLCPCSCAAVCQVNHNLTVEFINWEFKPY